MVRSLLTAVVVAVASVSAFAFPTITTYPTPGKSYDNVYYLESIQLQSTEKFSIVSDCDMKPYFENWDTGDMIQCAEFYDQDFMGSVLHKIEFNESDFSDNGEWVLTIPSGCLKDAAGNINEDLIEFHYTLADPNIGVGDFPQIKLISSNPANGAKLPYWGEYIGKMTFVTDNDDAVNYIDWRLYDITKGDDEANRKYIRQGNESRIDVNRTFGDDSDQWANGIYINVGGYNEPLVEGHTYRLYLKFCGIGYDPVTNQYPTPQQQAASLELETYLDFTGQTKGTEYSPYVVESVMPDPADYDFDNINIRTFTVTYSGPVKPTKFIYSLGVVGTETAGTYEPASDATADGYANVWDFTFAESVLKGADGTISITIEAKDADGLPVKGSGDYDMNNFEYKIDWNCNLGADVLKSVSPENGATVEQLSTITISNEAKKPMNMSWVTIEKPTIVSMSRAGTQTYIELDEPVFSDDETTATWTFEPVTAAGTYSLIIPKQYFIIGSEQLTTLNNQTSFVYIVEGNDDPVEDIKHDLEPSKVSIENNQVLTTPLESIVLTFADVTYIDLDPIVPGELYRENASSEYEWVENVEPMDDDFFSPKEYTYTFASPVSESGKYKFVVPAGAFYDEAYDSSEHTSGSMSPELVYYFEIEGSGDDVILELVSVEPETGAILTELSSVTITNTLNKAMAVSDKTIEKPCLMSASRDGVYIELDEPVFSDDAKTVSWTFDAITTTGKYLLTIPDQYFIVGDAADEKYNEYTIFAYNVEGDEEPVVGVEHDLVPATVSIENNAVLNTALESITLTFANVTYADIDWDWNPIAPGVLYIEGANSEYEEVETVQPKANDDFSPTEYTYTFAQPVNAVGKYKFVIDAGVFYNDPYYESEGKTGNNSPELVYYFQIETKGSGIESILAENETATVYDVMGRIVLRNANAEQLKALTTGIYIINGKKYIVK